ncbi:TPA: hypothetical protein ROY17_005944, partial [Bacillus thuringiensis]|nr:hypothetical protein [Bacillus thuringiensis]
MFIKEVKVSPVAFSPDSSGWWTMIEGNWYYIEDGKPATGWKDFGQGLLNYLNPDGSLFMGTGFETIEGKQYYFNEDHTVFLKTGAQVIEGKQYYFNEDHSVGVDPIETKTVIPL